MADIITALRSGINEQMLNALHSILRNVYATGRSSRGILRQVLQVSTQKKDTAFFTFYRTQNIQPFRNITFFIIFIMKYYNTINTIP